MLALLMLNGATVKAQQVPVADEAQVKAAYLHKFPAFIEWPAASFATPHSPVLIAVADADAVLEELSRQAVGRTVQGRPIEVIRLASDQRPPEVHLLYIGRDGRRPAAALLAQLAGHPVLTVTDSPAGIGGGAVLNLLNVDGRIRFEASLAAAAANRLKISSRLLGVASRVLEKTP